MLILHPTGGYICKVYQPFSRQSHANCTQVAAMRMKNWEKNLHACSGHRDLNFMQLAAKPQTHMQNLLSLAAITMQSRQ